jgi:hypothetical protein
MKGSTMKSIQLLCGLILGLVGSRAAAPSAGFPYLLPDEKPDRPLSVAMQRLYAEYLAPTPEAYFSQGLSKKQPEQREQRAKAD